MDLSGSGGTCGDETLITQPPVGGSTMVDVVASPQCVLPPKAVTALDQATVDEVLLEGAYAEMAHLPVAAVLGQAWRYAEALLEGQRSGAAAIMADAGATHGLLGLGLLPEDARFLSQVIALRDLAHHHGIASDAEAVDGLTLGEALESAIRTLIGRAEAWAAAPGQTDPAFRVTKDDMKRLWPLGLMPPGYAPSADEHADLFAVFVAIPLTAAFLMPEDDCLIEPRLV